MARVHRLLKAAVAMYMRVCCSSLRHACAIMVWKQEDQGSQPAGVLALHHPPCHTLPTIPKLHGLLHRGSAANLPPSSQSLAEPAACTCVCVRACVHA